MAKYDDLNSRLEKLNTTRFKDFERELIRGKALNEGNDAIQKKRQKNRRENLATMGTDLKKFDEAVNNDNRFQEVELKRFLEEFRPKSVKRPRVYSDSKELAIQSEAFAQAGQMVLPVYAASVFSGDKAALEGVFDSSENWTNGAINSGWVMPDDPTRIRVKDIYHDLSLCWPNRYTPPHEFSAHFTFIPATTGKYDLTAVMAFHGFYVLVADDSFWNCRFARVKLTAQMNVHQYVDTQWKDFPSLLELEKDNVSEVTNFDRTFFFDCTAELHAGDPVIVTVKGVVEAFSHGGYTYAELNFEAGTANYIEPVLLSVGKA